MRPIFVIGTSLTVAMSAIIGQQAYSQNVNQAFEALPACQKLDAIAADGKSISMYITGSGFDDFALDVLEQCPKYLVDLGRAWETMAQNPNLNMFERLSPCAQLNAIESDDKSVSSFIVDSGYETYARPVLANCPRHLEELGIAWLTLHPDDIIGGDDGTSGSSVETAPSIEFEDLPRCDQLDVIASTPGKSVVSHIFFSGIEDYEYAVRFECSRHLDALRRAEELAQLENQNTTIELPLNLEVATPNHGLNPEFERLAPCQKLDVIQGTGKSVPQYIADSGIEDFRGDIYQLCRDRHEANLIAAETIVENRN